MKRTLSLAALTLTLISGSVFARDDQKTLPLLDALDTPAAREKLDKNIKLHFAGQPDLKVLKTLGEWPTSKKTNSFGKSVEEACNWAFLSAMLVLQERARKEGGNAVINIKSNYKNNETASATDYVCGDGAIMSGVAFKGTVAKLAD